MIVDVRLFEKVVRIYDKVLQINATATRDLKIVRLDENDKFLFIDLDCDYWEELIIKK